MTAWDNYSKRERQQIRREMLRQAEKLLTGLYASPAQRRAAARTMVDGAIAKERELMVTPSDKGYDRTWQN